MEALTSIYTLPFQRGHGYKTNWYVCLQAQTNLTFARFDEGLMRV